MNVGLVFGIIFALFLITMVLVFGTGVITDVFSFGSEAQVQKAIKNLEREVEELYYMARDSSINYRMNIPGSYRVCFVNLSFPEKKKYYPNPENTWNPGYTTVYRIDSKGYNIWYYKGKDDEKGNGYRVPYLSVPESFCATKNTKLYLVNHGLVEVYLRRD